MLRACAVLPVRVTYALTRDQLDVPDVSCSTEMVDSCDGRAFTCRDALLSCPLTDLRPPQFSETKV